MCRRFGTFYLRNLHRSCEQAGGIKGKIGSCAIYEGVWTFGGIPLIRNFGWSALLPGFCTRATESPKLTEYELRRSIGVVWRLGKSIYCSSWESNNDYSVVHPIAYYAMPNSFKILALSGS